MQQTLSRKRSNKDFSLFDYGDDVEYLISASLVGVSSMENTLMSARQVSKRWMQAVDANVDEWCARFTALKDRWMYEGGIAATMNCRENAVELLVKMEKMRGLIFCSSHGSRLSSIHFQDGQDDILRTGASNVCAVQHQDKRIATG